MRRNVASRICSGSSPALLKYLTDEEDADSEANAGVDTDEMEDAPVTVTLTARKRLRTVCIDSIMESHAPGARADRGSANHDCRPQNVL